MCTYFLGHLYWYYIVIIEYKICSLFNNNIFIEMNEILLNNIIEPSDVNKYVVSFNITQLSLCLLIEMVYERIGPWVFITGNIWDTFEKYWINLNLNTSNFCSS